MTTRIFDFAAGPYSSDELVVVRFEGRERISEPFCFDVTIAAGIEPERLHRDLLGANARLTMRAGNATQRRVQGIVRRVRADATDPERGLFWYTVTLVPRLWLLRRRRNSRVFQDQTVPAIVGNVLDEAGVRCALRLTRSYEARRYCVQYQETDLEFVERILAEEGIFYFTEDPAAETDHTESESVICVDHAEAYLEVDGDVAIPYRPTGGLAERSHAIHGFGCADALRSHAVAVRHYDYLRPNTDLSSSLDEPIDQPSDTPLSLYHYHFDLEEAEVRQDVAEVHLEQERACARVSDGESHTRLLAPGRRFVLAEHPDATQNRGWAVCRIEHRGHQPEAPGASSDLQEQDIYSNRFSCIPDGVPARPRRPARQLQQVIETATVVGPPGEEIYTDENGRIKVQFHWDRDGRRDEHSSCWLRVMQPWAGAAWGAQFIPRIGMEVVVAFSGGDVDRPIVLGCTYNGTHPPPFPLPGNATQSGWRTRSTPGGSEGNELVFDDASGAERIFVHATRDLDTLVEHDHARKVCCNESVHVQGGRTTTVDGDHVRTVMGNEIATVEKNQILHVVGKQLIYVDGETTDGAAVAEPREGFRIGRPDLTPSSDGVEPTAPGPAPVDVSVLRGKLLFRLSHLTEDLSGAGDKIDAWVAGAMAQLDAYRSQVVEVLHETDRLRRRARDPVLRWADVGALQTLRHRAVSMMHPAGLLTEAVARAVDEVRAFGDPRLAKLQDAACDRLFAIETEAQALVAQMDEAIARAEDAVPQEPASSTEGGESGRIGGSDRGGGGATDGFEDAGELHFLGPADDRGERSWVATEGGSRVEIQGGGEILSQDGFRIASKGCVVEMSNGTITLAGEVVDICAGTVKINGNVVTVKGNPIKLN